MKTVSQGVRSKVSLTELLVQIITLLKLRQECNGPIHTATDAAGSGVAGVWALIEYCV